MDNLAQFKLELDRFMDKVEDEVAVTTRNISAAAFDRVVKFSPIVTGSFISSNRIGVDAIDITNNPISELTPIPRPSAEAIAYAQLGKLAAVKPYCVVYVSNSIGHAETVEYGGMWGSAKIIPHAPYRKAYESVKTMYGL